MNIIIIFIITIASAEIIDYTREDYVLIENGDAIIYENYGDIFHMTNLTYYRTIFEINKDILNTNSEYKTIKSRNSSIYVKINADADADIDLIEMLLSQLEIKNIREKRGINELGTLWKWIAGTPDHDDHLFVTNKLSELIDNNNKQFMINSELFKTIDELRKTISLTQNDSKSRMAKQINKFIITELQNTIQTITLAKAEVLNTGILNLKDIQQIVNHEHESITLTDLMDISKFKILQNKDAIVIYIKYPIIQRNCKLYETRAVSQKDGKLLINKEIIKCNNTFFNVENCKVELRNTFCKLTWKDSCLSKILNKNNGNCTKIKEKNKKIEIIKDGAILLSGNHTVDNNSIEGVYLIIFENKTVIDNVTYENPTSKILNYIRTTHVNNYVITKYVDSNDEELKFKNINLMSKITKQIENHPISVMMLLMIIVLTYVILSKYIKKLYIKNLSTNRNRDEIIFDNMNKRVTLLTKQLEEAGRSS